MGFVSPAPGTGPAELTDEQLRKLFEGRAKVRPRARSRPPPEKP
jgi:hypothetical protein